MIVEKGYETEQGIECLNSCIYNFFRFYRVNVEPSDIYFEGDGFNIYYDKQNEPFLGSNMYNSNFNFMNKFNIDYVYKRCLNEESARLFLFDSIYNEKPLTIKVSSECLTYNSIFRQTEHSPHYINIIGLDEITNKVNISDGYIPTLITTKYQGWLDLDIIMEAWKGMEYYYLICDYKQEIVIDDKKIKKIIKNGLMRYINSIDNEDSITGINSVILLMDYIKTEFQKQDDNISKLILQINYQLQFDGFITSKIYLHSWIKKNNYNNLIISELVDEYSNIVDNWKKICFLLLKCGYSSKIDSFNKVYLRVQNLLIDEDRIIRKFLCEI